MRYIESLGHCGAALCSDLFFSFGGTNSVQDKIDVLLQPDLHTTIAVGLAAFLLAIIGFSPPTADLDQARPFV